jgi:hypothetical protein
MNELEKLRDQSLPGSTAAGPLPELRRFLRLSLDYSRERDFAKTWVETYQPAIEAHFDAGEGYDNAQLVAEIALVVASLAILLSNRSAWILSILLAVICIGALTSTFLKNTTHCFPHTWKHPDSGRRLSAAPQSSPSCK